MFALPFRRWKSRAREAAALFALAVALTDPAAHAEAQGIPPETREAPALRLTSPQSRAGGETFVTILLENAQSRPLQTFKTEFEFDVEQLTYIASRKGIAAELAGAELKVSVDTGEPAAKRARLLVTVTGSKPIPNGPVAELRFRVAEGLDGVNLKLEQRAEAFAPGGAKIEKLIAEAGEIRITSAAAPKVPLVFACFFYMH